MTKSQQQAIDHLTRVYVHMKRSAKLRRRANRSAELAALGILIATFVTDALEQRACNRKLQQLQQEKTALAAQLRRGPTSTLGAATRFALLAALRTIERHRRVHHLRRLAATAALALHERAARGVPARTDSGSPRRAATAVVVGAAEILFTDLQAGR